MTEFPERALRLVRQSFDAATVRRAVAYAREGRVHLVKPLPWPVVARVRGASGYVVTVDRRGGGEHLAGDCTCPVGVGCKHAAATALVVLADEDDRGGERRAAARQAVVGEWLSDLGRTGDAAPAPGEAGRIVAYLLDRRDGELALTVLQCARMRGGGLTAGTPMAALADPQRGAPRWVEVADLGRVALLRAVTRAAAQTTRLRLDRIHGALLADLASSGHLYWESTRGAPLAYGAPRRDALTWRPSDGDGDRLAPRGDVVLLPARETHYLDVAAGAIGPLDLGIAPELVQKLVDGPPVPTAMRATVERSLASLLAPALAEAAPPTDGVAAAAPAPLAPSLHVAVERGGEPGFRLAADARYGDERFELAAWDPRRPFARDLVAEGRFAARLAGLIDALPHRGRPQSGLELLADARQIAGSLVPTLRAEGWACSLADDFPHRAPLVDLEFTERLVATGDGRDWFSLELGVTIAGRTVPLLPILLDAIKAGELALDPAGDPALSGGGRNVELPDGELVHVPAERLRRWLRPLIEAELRGLERGTLVLPAAALAELDGPAGRFADGVELRAASQRLAALLSLAPRREEPSFHGELRPYQRLGLAWLRALHDLGYGGLLADDMGLGKTVQLLAFLDGLRAARAIGPGAPALVVAPRSVVGNWAAEAARFTPALPALVHLGGGRATDPAALARAPFVVTSYQTLARDVDVFRALRLGTVVFDEAQAIKNPDTQLRRAAAALTATSRFCITGTPIENHLGELWSQLDLAMPGLLGRKRGFASVFRRPIERHGAVAPLDHLRRRVRPFLLRRAKDAVDLDLPPKTEIAVPIELDAAQRDLYESLRLTLDGEVRAALAARGVHGSSMLILDALLKLRQVCCDPRLVKLPAARRVRGSAKLERLMDMLAELADAGRAALVFSQFTSMLDLIREACAAAGVPTLTLTGATTGRDAVVRRFQDGEAPVFLISLKAGGVGLNLTRADTVIHYDPWWNPAAEAQASDRAHRIGQTKPLLVYKLVARGTVEESIHALQDEKRLLGQSALRAGDVTQLAAEDLATLFRRIA